MFSIVEALPVSGKIIEADIYKGHRCPGWSYMIVSKHDKNTMAQ